MALENNNRQSSNSWTFLCKCFPISSSSSSSSSSSPPLPENEADKAHHDHSPPSSPENPTKRKPGGWKTMPYVLGNESFERLATMGLLANFQVFLMTVFHMSQVSASYLLNIWGGIGNFIPLLGAFISDAYTGRFSVIAVSSFASLLGMVTMTLIMAIPRLHPSSCDTKQGHPNQCKGPDSTQMGVLVLALGFLAIGTGGIRPCSLPFGVDQFDPTTDEGRKGINSFFNWYYTTFTIILLIAMTVVVYIQDQVSWLWGFSIPTILMACSIVLFFLGMRLYVYVKPEGSIFSGITQAFVAALKKRKLKVPRDEEGYIKEKLYDPPITGLTYDVPKLPLTDRYRFLNKAAIILDGEIKSDGSRVSPWKLASIQQIEEVKCLLKVFPVLVSGMICFVALAQQSTFTMSQALKMERHLGKFEIPAGSLAVVSMVTIGLWLPFYDRIIVPSMRNITKVDTGITLLQRIGIGNVFSVLSMIVAALIEKMRRDSAISHNRPGGVAPMTVMWLVPQLVLMGFTEAFNLLGQLEFYYKEFPQNMKSVANAMFSLAIGGASYLSSVLVMLVHKYTGNKGHPDWLTSDINAGRIDYFYYLIAVMGVLNIIYFSIVASRYQYKTHMEIIEDESQFDVELNDIKK